MTIESVQSPSSILMDHIDRIVHASHIQEMTELKKMIKFLDHLIQTIIHQIAGNTLSPKGAKIKILHLIGLIQHSMVGNHPMIKSQLLKLTNIYESKFNIKITGDLQQLASRPRILSQAKIQHFVESIQDTQTNPIYSENSQSLLELASNPINYLAPITPKPSQSHTELSNYYLSTLIKRTKHLVKIKHHTQYIDPAKPSSHPLTAPINFKNLAASIKPSITTTA